MKDGLKESLATLTQECADRVNDQNVKTFTDFAESVMDLTGLPLLVVRCETPYFNDGDVCENTNHILDSLWRGVQSEILNVGVSQETLDEYLNAMSDFNLGALRNLPWENLFGTNEIIVFRRTDYGVGVSHFECEPDS